MGIDVAKMGTTSLGWMLSNGLKLSIIPEPELAAIRRVLRGEDPG
jgi:hypothetical protein